ncbi:hypothetical protein DNTS_024650 [Danionella cerebrum]|uniref:Uncharacterized protein n=1 Tax=Danionella cerebrum TaxID=2873325 RepID=A0A553NHR2_9TELE|nr:hypothetical protein DNTS_024650 [Danionella translucida]
MSELNEERGLERDERVLTQAFVGVVVDGEKPAVIVDTNCPVSWKGSGLIHFHLFSFV